MSSNNASVGASPPMASSQTRNFPSSNDFQFAFPKFGDLPSSFMNNGSIAKSSPPNQVGQQPSASSSNPSLPGMARKQSSGSTNATSPTSTNGASAPAPANGFAKYHVDNGNLNLGSNSDDLNGLFSPSILETASRSNSSEFFSFNDAKTTSPSNIAGVHGNHHNDRVQKPSMQQQSSSTSLIASPISSMSQNGLDSSCGTTPESSADSPDNRKPSEAALNTINEETATQAKPEGKRTSQHGQSVKPLSRTPSYLIDTLNNLTMSQLQSTFSSRPTATSMALIGWRSKMVALSTQSCLATSEIHRMAY